MGRGRSHVPPRALAGPAVGGRGGKPIESVIFNQEQARFGVSVGVFTVAIGMVGPTLLRHGTPEQQERYLRAMLKGDELWCQLFSETEAGSELRWARIVLSSWPALWAISALARLTICGVER